VSHTGLPPKSRPAKSGLEENPVYVKTPDDLDRALVQGLVHRRRFETWWPPSAEVPDTVYRSCSEFLE
jgi:hypothetical protein